MNRKYTQLFSFATDVLLCSCKVIDLIKVYETINGVLHKRCSMCKAVKPVSEYSPAEDRDKQAVKLYWTYLTHIAPMWKQAEKRV